MIQFVKIRFYLGLLIGLVANQLNAQSIDRSLNDIVMPSANAVAFGKYGDIPVGHFTGVPNIAIPITTIQEGPLSQSVSLTYHASGIRVAEVASWVGLGWNLNFGGYISRTVVGYPDDAITGWLKGGRLWNLQRIKQTLTETPNFEVINRGVNIVSNKDLEPDIFSFTAGPYVGKFYFDSTGAPILIPKQDLQILKDGSSLNSFTIVTPDGVRYIYGQVMNDQTIEPAYEINNYENTFTRQGWYLVKIEDYTRNHWIKFKYDTEGYEYPNLSTTQVYRQNAASGFSISGILFTASASELGYSNSGEGKPTLRVDAENNVLVNRVAVSTSKRLTEITTASNYTHLVFRANTIRQDLKHDNTFYYVGGTDPKRLDAIDVETSAGSNYTKRFAFNYDYLVDASCNPTYLPDKHYAKRLRLLSVQETTPDGLLNLPPHIFEYEGDANYPSRLSKATDHWGFYNGHLSNNSHFVNVPTPLFPNDCTSATHNRESDEISMKKGMIKRITYPTGGSTDLEFEANQAMRKESSKVILASTNSCSNTADPTCCGQIIKLKTLSLNSSEIGSNRIRVRYTLDKTVANNNCNSTYFSIELKIYDAITGALIEGAVRNEQITRTQSNRCFDVSLKEILLERRAITSDYRFELKTNNTFGTLEIYQNDWIDALKHVGGLRIKRISTRTSRDDNPMVTEYDYTTENGSPSGVLLLEPRYVDIESNDPPVNGMATQGVFYGHRLETISSQSSIFISTITDATVTPLSDFNGYHINYNRVTEHKIGIGKTIYDFYQEVPNGLTDYVYGSFPHPPAPPLVKTGVNQRTRSFDAAQNLVASTVNDSVGVDYDIACQPVKFAVRSIGSIISIKLLQYNLLKPNFIRFIKKTELKDGVTTAIEKEYGRSEISLPTKIKTMNSDGIVHELEYKYPIDFTVAPTRLVVNPYNWLVTHNVLTPVEIYQKMNGITVEGSKIEFTTGLYDSPALIQWSTPMSWKSYKWKQGTAPNWQLTGEIKEYWPNGALKTFQAAGSTVDMEYTWNQGVLTQKKYGDLEWHFNYMQNNSRVLTSVVNENGIKMSYEYDTFLRMKRVNGKLDANENPVAWVETDYRYRGINGFTQNEMATTTHFSNLNIGDIMISDHALATQQYYDGLGRPTQSVKALMDGTFAKNFISYDALGRPERAFQVFQANNNDYAPLSQYAHYNYRNVKTVYEASPLSRPIQQILENGTTVSTGYGANGVNEVLLYRNGICNNEYYAANELFKTIATDENGKSTTIFKDKMGRVLLTRKVLNNSNVDTYNLYNDLGQLIAVLPPGCTAMESPLAFRYEYDFKNRLSRKRVPGAAWQEFYYDDRNLLVLTQDGNTRARNGNPYLATQYDELGRVIKTGWAYAPDKTETGLHALQILDIDALTKVTYEPNRSYVAQTETRVLEGQQLTGWLTNEVTSRDEWGKPTGIRQTHLDGEDDIEMFYNTADKPLIINRTHRGMNGASEVITQRFSYDEQLRPRETHQKFDGGIVQGISEMVLSQMNYNFKDQLIEKNIGQNVDRNGRFLQSIDYLYNGRGWLTAINGLDITATNRTVKTIPMVKKEMNMMTDFLEMDDTYTSTASAGNAGENPDLFSQVLNYETPLSGLQADAQYNGNISSTIWQVAGREMQGYGYKYDDLNRLTEAYYADLQETYNNYTWNRRNVQFSSDNSYKENIQYDVRGNITSLQRNGLKTNGFTGGNYVAGDFGPIDDLQYEYNGKNQVTRITDNAETPGGLRARVNTKGFVYNFDAAFLDEHYKYDANGNLTSDAHKDIETIEYNYLNLPAKITFTNDRTITFLYDATGKKLRKTVTGNGMTEQRDYLDGIEYKDGKPDQFLHSEGSVRMDKDGQFKYYFVLRDHLGNTRVTFSDLNNDDEINEKEEIIQINNYYAFGLNMEGNWNGANGANKYQYNGKEWNDDFGLGWNDYGARFYDPAMARWQTVDPLSDKMHRHSPYNYCFDNPIRFVDPDGMAATDPTPIPIQGTNGRFEVTLSVINTGHPIGGFNHRGVEMTATYIPNNASSSSSLKFVQIIREQNLDKTDKGFATGDIRRGRTTTVGDKVQPDWRVDRGETSDACYGWYGSDASGQAYSAKLDGNGYYFENGNPVIWDLPGSQQKQQDGITSFQTYIVDEKTGAVLDGFSWAFTLENVEQNAVSITAATPKKIESPTPELRVAVFKWNKQAQNAQKGGRSNCDGIQQEINVQVK